MVSGPISSVTRLQLLGRQPFQHSPSAVMWRPWGALITMLGTEYPPNLGLVLTFMVIISLWLLEPVCPGHSLLHMFL